MGTNRELQDICALLSMYYNIRQNGRTRALPNYYGIAIYLSSQEFGQ